MEKLTILGTGSAMVTRCYNTCFTLSNDKEHFLVDAGGGNTILSNLQKTGISITNIHHAFISHSHNDHITGIVWIIRAVAQQIRNEKYEGNLKIYCHRHIIEAIRTICSLILQDRFTQYIDNRILFVEIEDESIFSILGYNVKFFDIKSSKHLQFGFTTTLINDMKFTFLGDEPYREALLQYANGADYLLHEAFCLYSQKDIFHPYEKHHSTVKDACETAENLKVKNLLLYHCEDKTLPNRKSMYIEEGKKYFTGNILVPDDLEIINL